MATVKGLKNSTTTESSPKVLESQKSARIPDYVWEEAKKELKMVKGRFRIIKKDKFGDAATVTFRKYPPEICPMFSKSMKDGEVYEIPLYAARFINGYDSNAKALNGKINSCAVGKHGFFMNHADDLKPSQDVSTEAGLSQAPLAGIVKYEPNFVFESLDFSGELG